MTTLSALLEQFSPETRVADGSAGGVTAAELRESARRMAAALPRDIASLLVQSGAPRGIAESLLAAEMHGISLFLAHDHLGADEVEAIVRSRQIEAVSTGGEPPRPTGLGPAPETGFHVHLMTSGTTGAPKIARHTLESLLGRIEHFIGDPNLKDARWLLTYSPTTFAGVQVLLTALATGGCLVIPSGRTAPAVWQAAERYRATHMSGTPTFWRSVLLLNPMPDGLPPLRQITLGGEAVDQRTLDRLRSVFPRARITHMYASTEAGALFSVDDGRAGFPARWLEQPVSNVRLRIRNGELEVLSPRRMETYASAHAVPFLEDGWLRTGDVVRQEGDRVLFAGRMDTTINVGGMKVQPLEVEQCLLETDGVAEARVSGAANPITGQLVIAEIVVEPGRDPAQVAREAAAHARSRLASYKVPRSIRIVASIDTSPTGKKLYLEAPA